MKKLLLLAIATIMSLGASAQLITSNTVTYKKSSGYNRIGVSYNSISSTAEGSESVSGVSLAWTKGSRVSGGNFTLPSLGTVLDSLPSHGSSYLTLLFIN